jgi:sugar/nucleoside kinase (ribokinase family)
MSAPASVLVVGDVLVDIVVVPTGPLVQGSDTPASIQSLGGGAAANTACWLTARGREARLVAATGDDALGRTAIDDVVRAGVGWAGTMLPGERTGSCVVLVDASGERTMLPDRGANDALPPEVVEAAFADPPAWVHLSGYALLGAGSRPAGLAALALALEARIPVSVDAASAAPLRAVGAATFLDWIAGCTVVFANDDEVGALGGAGAVLERCEQLVGKHGAAGSSWTDGTGTAAAAAKPVVVVDTVGAGDAFDAGFIDATLAGATPSAALDGGAAVAALAVARPGARPRDGTTC